MAKATEGLRDPHRRLGFVQCQHRSSQRHPVMCVLRGNAVHKPLFEPSIGGPPKAVRTSRASASPVKARRSVLGNMLRGRHTAIGHQRRQSTGPKYSSPYCGTCAGPVQHNPSDHIIRPHARPANKMAQGAQDATTSCACLYNICHWQNNETSSTE